MQLPSEDIIKAIRWRLGVPVDQDAGRAHQMWSAFAQSPGYQEQAARICQSLAGMLEQAVQLRLNPGADHVANKGNEECLASLWEAFVHWFYANEAERSPYVSYKIREALTPDSLPSGVPPSLAPWGRDKGTTDHRANHHERTSARVVRLLGAYLRWVTSFACEQLVYVTKRIRRAHMTPADHLKQPWVSPAGTWPSAVALDGNQGWVTQTSEPPSLSELPNYPAFAESSPAANDVATASGAPVTGMPSAQGAAASPQEGDRGDASGDDAALPPCESPVARQVAAQWKYLPVPDGPDKHEECDCRPAVSPEGLRVIGARVRGVSHKHEGINCDDWFEVAVSDPWTVIAVSDGAGSHQFSRVGARVSCQAAVAHLAATLRGHRIKPRHQWSGDTLKRNETSGVFAEEDLECVQKALHQAVWASSEAVEAAATARAESPEHVRLLGRKLVPSDLSATLLLAVHTTVKYKDTDYSFVLTCQIGDGMLAVVDRRGTLQLLGRPDRGDFKGQTDFLSNKSKLDREHLWRKTLGFFGPLQALMVMTDGIADIYFPDDPGMLRLYGDLVLNQVVDIPGLGVDEIVAALAHTRLPTLDDVAKADFHSQMKAITANGSRAVRMRSVASYAEKLGRPLAEVVASPALLLAGTREGQVFAERSAEARLQSWLDAYEVPGERDDRTLVMLYREMVS
jgi:hypothetical protein